MDLEGLYGGGEESGKRGYRVLKGIRECGFTFVCCGIEVLKSFGSLKDMIARSLFSNDALIKREIIFTTENKYVQLREKGSSSQKIYPI